MKLFKYGVPIFLLFLILAGCSAKKDENSSQVKKKAEKSAAVGPAAYVEKASFEKLDGGSVDISDYKGKVVMIDFWETWCKPCIGSFPTVEKLLKEYPDDFVVLAVTPGFSNTKQDAREFRANHDYDFVYLYDSNKLHEKLNVQGIPFKVFVDPSGKFIKTAMGSYGEKEDYRKIKSIIEDHKNS